jgi:hypothetical protein
MWNGETFTDRDPWETIKPKTVQHMDFDTVDMTIFQDPFPNTSVHDPTDYHLPTTAAVRDFVQQAIGQLPGQFENKSGTDIFDNPSQYLVFGHADSYYAKVNLEYIVVGGDAFQACSLPDEPQRNHTH